MEEILNPNEYGGLLYDCQEVKAVENVILNNKIFRYALKEKSETDIFEERICERFGRKYALGVNSGTSAIKVALKAIGINHGDRVLVSSYTFLASATSVLALDGIPVPLEFDLNYGVNIQDLENELKKGCKAVILVHLQGKCFDIKPIIELKNKYHFILIEDACQAMGTRCKGVLAGTLSDIGIFSFQQNKPLTSGEGGVLLTDNEDYYKISRNYADMGSVRDYYPSWDKEGALIGDNYRMNNLQGAILNVQLSKFDKMMKIQRKNKKYILDNLDRKNMLSTIINDFSEDDTGINILFLNQNKNLVKECIEEALKEKIEMRYLWARPYYLQKVIANAKLTPNDFEKNDCCFAEKVAETLISISLPPVLNQKQLDVIINLLNHLIKEKKL